MARKIKGHSFDPSLLLATTGRGRTKLEYQSEGVIFSQGDAADSIFDILRGKIKIVVTSEQGREAVVALLGEGDFFGEGCLIAQPLRLAKMRRVDGRWIMLLGTPKHVISVRQKSAQPHSALKSRSQSDETATLRVSPRDCTGSLACRVGLGVSYGCDRRSGGGGTAWRLRDLLGRSIRSITESTSHQS